MKLSEIATAMRQAVASGEMGYAGPQRLGRGLELILFRRGDRWRLSLRRDGVYPSDQEIKICSAAFALPQGTEPARRITKDWSEPGRKRMLYTVDLAWIERDGAGASPGTTTA